MSDDDVVPPGDRLENAIAYRVVHAARVLRLHLSRFLEDQQVGIGPEQYFVLYKVCERPGCGQVDLTDAVLADYPNVTRLVDGLVSRGLLTRRHDPTDRRRRMLELTVAGANLMESLMPRVVAERHALFRGIERTKITSLIGTLDALEAAAASRLQKLGR